ncbi:hypothetical protein [Novosphingobium sp. FKTRR1]|uniref:AbrB/MazE/SpoVT family DNA-binding domain-containing protein n=1 Tax=Novosphingobium sp. FKTRR1 TaxID=2879118 RepID=UPI001CF0655B|nr:hypothetical protein [Novosphingobium sp. FKTRR1]
MGREYIAKSFKSGNSVAIRIPAALGVEPDQEWIVARDDSGDLLIRPKPQAKAKLDVSKFWGKAKGLKVPGRRDFDERPSTIAARAANATK